MSEIEQEMKAMERKLNIILDNLKDGNIITASWLIKKLAIALDRRGYAEKLKGMLRASEGSPKPEI